MQRSPEHGGSLPAEVLSGSLDLQIYCVRMFEMATGKVLIPNAGEYSEMYAKVSTDTEYTSGSVRTISNTLRLEFSPAFLLRVMVY